MTPTTSFHQNEEPLMTDVTPAAVQTLLDKDAIKEVLYRFNYLCDGGDPVEAAARYCTDDIKFDGGVLGAAEGREAFQDDLTFVTPYEKGWAKQPFIEGIPGTLEW